MDDNLILNLEEIKRQKEEYIIPKNIKKDVTIFGITGTLEGDIEDLQEQLDNQDRIIEELQKELETKSSAGSGYKEIKWVKNLPTAMDNAVHFNTNYIPNYSTKVEFHVLESDTECYFCSSFEKYGTEMDFYKLNAWGVCNDGDEIFVAYANQGGGYGGKPIYTDEHTYTLDRNKFYIDGVLRTTLSSSSTYKSRQPIYFFAQNRSGNASLRNNTSALTNGSCKLTYIKIWDNDVLVHHFVPIQFTGELADCKYGMLDKINNTVHSFSNPLEIIGGEE